MSSFETAPTVLGMEPAAYAALTRRRVLRGCLLLLPVLGLQLALLFTARDSVRAWHELPTTLLGILYGWGVILLADTVWGARRRLLRLYCGAQPRPQEGVLTAVGTELSRSHGVWCYPLTLSNAEGERTLLLPKDGVLHFAAGDRVRLFAETGIILAGEVTAHEA